MNKAIPVLAALLLAGNGAFAQKALVEIERHDSVTVYYPHFKRIDLVTGIMPGKGEESVIFVCEAAFTGQILSEFRHDNIAGDHVSGGEFHEGYSCKPNNGVFTWSRSAGWHFYNYSYKNRNTKAVLQTAAKQGGMGFCQNMLFCNSKQYKGCFPQDRKNQYRALCEIKGRLCIVDCARELPFGSFLSALKKLGVKNAVYCDMGYGWNYSWYRRDDGKVEELFRTPGRYTTNWITFYSE